MDRLSALVESRLPVTVESDGREDDWNVVGPAMLAAAVRHVRALAHLKEEFPSTVIGWQLLRSMFEYLATYAWVAADAEGRVKMWLKYDYVYRLKLDNDFRGLRDTFLEEADRQRVANFLPNVTAMPDLVSRARAADEAWSEQLHQLEGYLPDENRTFRSLYPIIYRNGSRFTHPSSHVVNAFVAGNPPQLVVGDERPLDRDLTIIATGVLAAGLTVVVTATPALELTIEEIHQALSA